MRDLSNLHFLRSCAVVSVVVEHILLAYGVQWLGSWEVQWIGVVGVFIFFVHTSLVLMWSLERKPHTLDFYIRRVFRIYPLALIAFCVAVHWRLPLGGTPAHYFRYLQRPADISPVLKSAFLIGNLGHGYYFMPMSVMWSLPYEVEMYVVLPFLFFFVQQNFSLWPLLLLFGLDLTACYNVFRLGDAHNLFKVALYFLPGVMAYVGFGKRKAFLPSWSFPIYLVALWTWFMHDPYFGRAVWLCLVLGLTLPLFRQIPIESVNRMSTVVAEHSYGIYLSHPFGILLGLYCLPHASLAVQLLVILSSTALLSAVSYRYVERPMIRLGSRLAAQAEQRYEQKERGKIRIPEAEIA